ncbi:hypothetical protein HUN43_00060 [Streptomyces phage Endor1]|uniref:Uncharacterized protein n=1 Tax=Streptomyces phage Endor1 TaxID=2740181 RepID=A0A7G4AWX2_9CAUD|nr:hypothetical protein KGG92_gp60 [Streptomyces phage Endor1]QMP84512.1 hypothetical protein HUN43_00060 [Streptomyces phage Endor1]
MPWVGNEYRPTTEEAVAALTYDKYGEEYEWWTETLAELVKAVRRDVAKEIREHQLDDPMGRHFYTGAGADYYAQLINPDEEDPK